MLTPPAKYAIADKPAAESARLLLIQYCKGDLQLSADQRAACNKVQDSFLYRKPLQLSDIAPLVGVGGFTQDRWGK